MRKRIAAAVTGALLAVGAAVVLADQASAETMPRIMQTNTTVMPHG